MGVSIDVAYLAASVQIFFIRPCLLSTIHRFVGAKLASYTTRRSIFPITGTRYVYINIKMNRGIIILTSSAATLQVSVSVQLIVYVILKLLIGTTVYTYLRVCCQAAKKGT